MSYNYNAATVIGILHILCGVVAFGTAIGLVFSNFVFGILVFVMSSSIIFCITGGLIIGSVRNTSSCLVISTLVMSVISAISAGIVVIFSGLSIVLGECNNPFYDYCNYTAFITLNGLQLMTGITEIILAITSSALSCRGKMYRPMGDQEQIVSNTLYMDQKGAGLQNTGDLPTFEDIDLSLC
jgi:hypothetical protein